jgi:hypothetical protein
LLTPGQQNDQMDLSAEYVSCAVISKIYAIIEMPSVPHTGSSIMRTMFEGTSEQR